MHSDIALNSLANYAFQRGVCGVRTASETLLFLHSEALRVLAQQHSLFLPSRPPHLWRSQQHYADGPIIDPYLVRKDRSRAIARTPLPPQPWLESRLSTFPIH